MEPPVVFSHASKRGLNCVRTRINRSVEVNMSPTWCGIRLSIRRGINADWYSSKRVILESMFKLLFLAAIILGLSQSSNAKGWRGLIPLHSTRDDVIRLLGPSPGANDMRATYSLEKEDVYIGFASDEPYPRCSSGVPREAVLTIEIRPKTKLRLSDLRIDQSKYRTFDPSSPPSIGYVGLINDVDGVVIQTFKGYVSVICYIANIEDRKLCWAYYEHPEDFVSVIVHRISRKFDEYAELSLEDEKARLDNFAILLQNEPDSVGYVIVYAGHGARINEAKEVGERAKRYLIKTRKINRKRVITIDGGHREQLTTELYLQRRGLPPPPVSPTVKVPR